MSLVVLALVLFAALAHAAWNLLAKQAAGGSVFVWLAASAGALIYLPAFAVSVASTRNQLDLAAIGLMSGSGVLHAAYFVLLQRGYSTGELSLVYPLARGTGPLLSVALAIAFLGERPSALAIAGASIIVAAVFSLARGGRAANRNREAIGFALLTGATIAAYTLWDKHAVGPDRLSPIAYYWGANLVNVALLTPWALSRRELVRTAWATSWREAAGVGLLSPLAYILVLYALARAPVSYVAPARETSILIATVLGATVLGETDPRRKLVCAALMVLGVVALAVG